jgi:hypothetical protein
LDVLTSVLFFALAAVSLIGALGVALLPAGGPRALAFLLVAVGAAGMYALLAAGFAALVALVVLVASGLLLAPLPRTGAEPAPTLAHQVAAIACAALFAVLAYAAYRGGLFAGTYAAGDFGLFNAAAMGRLLLGRDALATDAAGALLLLALVTGGARWAGWAVTSRRRR